MKSVFHGSVAVVKRSETDTMACRYCLHLLDPRRSDKSSSLRKRFEAALQSKSHAFEKTSVDHVREWMPIQNSVKIRSEVQAASDLSQTSEEDFGVRHLRVWGEVFWVAGIANNGVGRDPAQKKRRRCEAGGADDKVGLCREFLQIGSDLCINSIGLQLGSEATQSGFVARAKQDALYQRR